jgi:peptidylprolyl isomerase
MQAKKGDTVSVHYTGSLEDGTVFDSSQGGEPIEFRVGAGGVIPGFDEAIVGMAPGEKKRERIDVKRAYGERRDDLVFEVERDQIPDNSGITVGDVLQVGFDDGNSAAVQVAAVDESTVTLDANHPLSGKVLVFDLELVAIK